MKERRIVISGRAKGACKSKISGNSGKEIEKNVDFWEDEFSSSPCRFVPFEGPSLYSDEQTPYWLIVGQP